MTVYTGDWAGRLRAKGRFIEALVSMHNLSVSRHELYKHELGDPIQAGEHAATDGGMNRRELASYTFYAVRGYTVAYTGGNEGYRPSWEELYADIGIVIPPGREDTRVSMYRDIVEIWTALKTVEHMNGGDSIYLGDGSVISLVTEPVVHRLLRRRRGVGELLRCIEDYTSIEELRSESLREPLAARRLLGLDEEKVYTANTDGGTPLGGEYYSDCATYAEFLEKSLLLMELFRSCWRRGITPIYISKTSRTSFLYGDPYFTDLYIIYSIDPFEPGFYLNKTRVREGIQTHLWMLKREGVVSSRDYFPGDSGLDEFYGDLAVFRFYARLQYGAPVLKVEIPLSGGMWRDLTLTPGGENAEALASQVTGRLLGLPLSEGYPLVLRRVHERSKISPRELDYIVESLGLNMRRGAREVLGE